MTDAQKLDFLISPEKYFPTEVSRGKLLGNVQFIESTVKYGDLLAESQYWERKKIETIQVERLRKLTGSIALSSEFWSKTFIEHGFPVETAALTDLCKLPVLDRTTIHKLGDALYVNPLLADGDTYQRTSSGTTGIPLKLIYNEREMIIGFIALIFRHPVFEKINLAELLKRKPFVNLGMPGFWHICKDDFFERTFQSISVLDLEKPEVRREIYKSIERAKPAILVGYASLIARLAYWVSKDNISLPLIAIRITSEPITLEEQGLIFKHLNAPIVNMLSGNGTGFVGFECSGNLGKFHLNSESMILETVDEHGSILKNGEEGELVISAFMFTLTPIIRYAHNDMGKIISEQCVCGRTLPLFEFHGRRGYEIVLPDGKKLRMMHLYGVLWQNGLGKKSKQIQIIQNSKNSLQIIIVPRKPFSEYEEGGIYKSLAALFKENNMNFEIKYADSISPGKGRKPCLFIPLSEYQQ